MPYNEKDAAHVSSLKSELSGDPKAMGYAGDIASENWFAVSQKLATVPAAPESPLPIPTFNTVLVAEQFLRAQYIGLSDPLRGWVDMFIAAGGGGSLTRNAVQMIRNAFPAGGTRDAIDAILDKAGERGEELFGLGTRIEPYQALRAHNS